jgi:hypothetical protein
MAYTCFTRAWYRIERNHNTGAKKLVPNPGARRTKKAVFKTEQEARDFCTRWNNSHNPGPTSVKCEYTSDY